jgi:hypothetical protein
MTKKKEPTKQLNLRLRLPLIKAIREMASSRGIKPSKVFLGLLEDAANNRCRHCRGGMAPGGTAFHPKPCKRCFGTGRVDIARAIRKDIAHRTKEMS